jgi:hypothetical protein
MSPLQSLSCPSQTSAPVRTHEQVPDTQCVSKGHALQLEPQLESRVLSTHVPLQR